MKNYTFTMEHNNHPHESIKDTLLKKIEANTLVMRPRMYFTLRVAAVAVLAVIVLAISILLFNFLLFSIDASGRGMLLHFGPRGYFSFLAFFPWPLLLLDAVLVVLLGWLVKQFKFGYKSPLLYMFAALFVCTVGVGVMVSKSGFNDLLIFQTKQGHLPPPFEHAYNYGRRPPPRGEGVCLCTITAIKGNTISAEDRDTHSTMPLTIILPPNDLQATTSGLHVGDLIFVVGDEHSGVIHAFGVRQTPEQVGE